MLHKSRTASISRTRPAVVRPSSGTCCHCGVLCRGDKAVLLGRAPAGGGGDGEEGGIGDDRTYASAASSRERRRLSIKAAKVRRRKQEVEITAMEAEDERSKLENQEYRVSHKQMVGFAGFRSLRVCSGCARPASKIDALARCFFMSPAEHTFVTVIRRNVIRKLGDARDQAPAANRDRAESGRYEAPVGCRSFRRWGWARCHVDRALHGQWQHGRWRWRWRW